MKDCDDGRRSIEADWAPRLGVLAKAPDLLLEATDDCRLLDQSLTGLCQILFCLLKCGHA